MIGRSAGLLALLGLALLADACSTETVAGDMAGGLDRPDGARMVDIGVSGSLQNPAWSPDGQALLVTRFRNGYNQGPADLFVVDLTTGQARLLVSDGSDNISLPGAAWNAATGQVVLSSARDPHDEIYVIGAGERPGDEVRITHRDGLVAYEPSLSPDGEWVVFESHRLDVEGNGVITKCMVEGGELCQPLTDPAGDCRQPNWAPAGGLIACQCLLDEQWSVWVMDEDGAGRRRVTSGVGDATDSSFSPDGEWLIYSYQVPGADGANLYVISAFGGNAVRVTEFEGYDGAPSWSPDGRWITFESCPGEPDESEGTTIWMIAAPSG